MLHAAMLSVCRCVRLRVAHTLIHAHGAICSFQSHLPACCCLPPPSAFLMASIHSLLCLFVVIDASVPPPYVCRICAVPHAPITRSTARCAGHAARRAASHMRVEKRGSEEVMRARQARRYARSRNARCRRGCRSEETACDCASCGMPRVACRPCEGSRCTAGVRKGSEAGLRRQRPSTQESVAGAAYQHT